MLIGPRKIFSIFVCNKFIHQFYAGKMLYANSSDSGDSGKLVSCLLVGAGSRGHNYSSYAIEFPEEFKIVGVVEPRTFFRNREQEEHKIQDDFVFEEEYNLYNNIITDWPEAAAKDKFADCVIIATPDRKHKDPAVAFAKKGYHILLEKPMAVTEEECREIVSACKESNVLLAVCHVLRYASWAQKIKEIIDSGEIGEVVNIQHTEPVGFWHFAHSFVRGNWHNEASSSNALLAKCCHDVDLIAYWMSPHKCIRVSSFGHLSHFRKEDKPKGAGSHCLDCSIESECPYSAKKIYIDRVKLGLTGWPVSVVAEVPDIENVTDALRTGPYGCCVYECNNDVMSHQVTNFQFDNGATSSLSMVAFTSRLCAREVKVYGTKGQITCDASRYPKVEVFDFLSGKTREVDCSDGTAPGRLGGHGNADFLLMQAFVQALRTGRKDLVVTGAEDTLTSHLLVFAAEKARKENRVVEIQANGTFTF